jgi:hypothetical protein
MAYYINYPGLVHDTLPPDKRTVRHAKWLIALLSPLTWLKEEFFVHYMQGAVFPAWAPFTAYAKGERVSFNRSVWESLVENNNFLIPHPNSWKKVYESLIGAEERIRYSGHTLVLEYALNKMFSKTFRQPPLQSQIYITTQRVVNLGFIVGLNNDESSSAGFDDSVGYVRAGQVNELTEISQGPNFTIYAPNDIVGGEDAISRFAGQFVPQGINFNVQLYIP